MCFWLPILIGLGSAILGGIIGWLMRNPKINSLNSEIDTLKSEYSDLSKTHDDNLEKYRSLNARYSQLSTDINVVREESRRHEEEIAKLKQTIKSLRSK